MKLFFQTLITIIMTIVIFVLFEVHLVTIKKQETEQRMNEIINSQPFEADDEYIEGFLREKYNDIFIIIENGDVKQSKWDIEKSKHKCDDVQCECLAYNIYHESRGENTEGKVAVAKVTMNRVESKRFPNTICEVVRQYKQFSWTLNSNEHKWRITDISQWNISKNIAINTIKNEYEYELSALHYHRIDINPNWNDTMTVEKVIGQHIFFKNR